VSIVSTARFNTWVHGFGTPILDPRASQGHFEEKLWVQGGWCSGKQAEADFRGGLARPGRSRIQEGCMSQDEPRSKVSLNMNEN
jgi:predicted NAD/FAD-dependent oxidoreductase